MYSDSKMFLKTNSKTILRVTWTLCWITATLYTTVQQCRHYYTVEDQTVIEYKRFNERETDVYPSFSLCWTMIINEEKLKGYANRFTSGAYIKFLFGDIWDKDMLAVDYDTVTTRLQDHLLEYGYTKSSTQPIVLYDKQNRTQHKPGFREEAAFGRKCLKIDIPFEKGLEISRFYVLLESSIFGKNVGMANPFKNYLEENKFTVALHYPKQSLGHQNLGKLNWFLREPEIIAIYSLTVGHMDVRVRRNTNQNPCIEGVPDYDMMAAKTALETVGCKPPYWNSTPWHLAQCSEQEQLRVFRRMLSEATFTGNRKLHFMDKRPCRTMERIHYDLQTTKNQLKGNDTVAIILDFSEFTYKEVKNLQGMDLQTLIGKVVSSNILLRSLYGD